MPQPDESVIILESDDDEDGLSGDKDDVVFVNMTPVSLKTANIKSYLTPISIDSDDEDEEEDDDIIFVSATRGKRRKSHGGVLQSVTSLEQTLTSLEQSVNESSDGITLQTGGGDLLTSTHDEPLIIQPIPPKLPPQQPSFHDSPSMLGDTEGLDLEELTPVPTAPTVNGVDGGKLDSVDSSELTAFLAADVTHVTDTCSSLNSAQSALSPWVDTNSEPQGMLAWLGDLPVPANLPTPTNVAVPVTDSSKAGPSQPSVSSRPLTSWQTIDNLLPPSQQAFTTLSSVTSSTSSYDTITSSSMCPWNSSSMTPQLQFSLPGTMTSLTKSLLSDSAFLNQASNPFQTVAVGNDPVWSATGGTSSDNNNNGTVSGSYTPSLMSTTSATTFTSMTITPSTSSPSQFSGAITISPLSVSTSSTHSSTPVTHKSPPPSPGGFNSLTLTSPSQLSGGSIPSAGTSSPDSTPQMAGCSAIGKGSLPNDLVQLRQRKVAGSASSQSASSQKTPLVRHTISYMHTHPNNIPLKKRRRHRHGPRLSLDSATDCQAVGDSDSSKCSWCKLMVPYNNLSYCMQGHPCCADCLQHRAKALLSKSKRGSLKCPYTSCISYFPMSQLQRTLPPMVVEILEEKLDREYINYADDLLWHNIGESQDAGDGSAVADEDEEEDEDDDMPQPGGDRVVLATLNKQPSLPLLPAFWEPMNDTSASYKLVELSSENIEFTKISLLFSETMRSQASISRILRIQNPILWQFYNVKKLQLQDAGGEPVVEKQLMHGTSNNVVDAICKTNFDWRLCGAHGTMYGQGSYFARDASYSHVYTDNARNRSLHNPTHILAMLSKNKKVRANQVCLKRLASNGSMGLGVMINNQAPVSGNVNLQATPPAAHWNQTQPQNIVLQANIQPNPSTVSTQSKMKVLLQRHAHELQKLQSCLSFGGQQQQCVQLNSAAGTTSPALNALLQRHAHQLQSSLSFAAQPPPAHQHRPMRPGCSSGASHHHPSTSSSSSRHSTSHPHSSLFRWSNLASNDTSSSSSNPSLPSSSTPAGSLPPTSSSSCSSSSSPTPQKKRPIHSMFVAKVLVGNFTSGHTHYRKPPPIDQSDPYGRAYDSCVDNVNDPKIYVVFDSAQCYPEYLIEYTSTHPNCYM